MTIATKDMKILIIDDNPAIHSDFIKILSTKNSAENVEDAALDSFEKQMFGLQKKPESSLPKFRIVTATQGQDGVAKIAEALHDNDPYALAFVDIRMPPGWDGIETTKKIWQLDPNIQIVICTAYSDYTWEETIQQLGQRENLLILKKPFDSIAVRQLSCALTKKWQLLQESRDYTKLLETQVKERTQSLQESLSVTRGTLEASADGILVMNNTNSLIDYNKNLMHMFHIPKTMMAKNDANALLHYIAGQMENSHAFLKITQHLASKKNNTATNTLRYNKNQVVEIYTQPYKIADKITGRIWCFRDITKRAQLEAQLQYQATHDALTQLPNRILLAERLTQTISCARRNKTMFCFLFFDLDRFKLINDSFSHIAGDKLLQEAAKRLQKVMRKEDILARLGGDEFVALLESLANDTQAGKIANKLLQVFNKPFIVNGQEILVTPSIGIAVFPQDGQTFEELLRSADIAMYNAKEQGGNQFQYYSANLGEKSAARLQLESDLHRAIENKEFFLCYQPQLDLATQKLVSAEALIRWHHPEKGILLPINFIPLAEETGLILPIGEWVLREACKQNKRWQELGFPKIRIAVNIASKQLKQPNLADIIKTILLETGLEPQYLELEITENVILTGGEINPIFAQLKKLGVHFALDDFGAGYTLLNHLKIYPIDRIKIDPSYINNINVNHADEVIIQAIITLAKNLKLDVIAEGVESKEQLEFLQSHHCNEIQGHYFCEPLAAQDFEQFLQFPGLVNASKKPAKLDNKN
ncbi:regulatory protein (GGDEF and EAL domains) [Legionella donaldsonii]|uniref:Regulatory protein (GGDEF and EAL domains) n=1 Tax=Legionella donaldsonii TaxID=45060 RepID=A0A378IYA4_9GAMM|nr:EAL domain-containing protein [Legionella donaldsonii]STX40454.1 regulatory protein (GGDEF and EAL domains) [Legionella donaldsonii]